MKNIAKILSLLEMKNIDTNQVFALVDMVKSVDLQNEDELRGAVSKISQVINRDIPKEVEDKIVKKIKEEGISPSLLEFLF